MRLTIDQILQQHVAAHNLGKLQEAEPHFSEVFKNQPDQPDTNYSLELVGLSMNHSEIALPL